MKPLEKRKTRAVQTASELPAAVTEELKYQSPLIKVITGWRNKLVSMDEVVHEFYHCDRVRKITRHVARKAGIELPVDEGVQLTATRFFTEGIMDKIYDEENLYSLIYSVALNAIRQEAESNLNWERKHEFVSDTWSTIEDMRVVEDFSDSVLKKINLERSGNELMRRMENQKTKDQKMTGISLTNPLSKLERGIEHASSKEVVVRPRKVSKPGQVEKKLSPDAEELQAIRKRLGYLVEDFARAINVSRDTLSAALYGRMNPVPDEIMQCSRNLLETSMAEIRTREAKFKRFENMDALVCFWLTELELEDNRKGEEELAVILGVYHSTLFRWRKDEYKPQLADLERYDQNVRNAVKHRALVKNMIAGS